MKFKLNAGFKRIYFLNGLCCPICAITLLLYIFKDLNGCRNKIGILDKKFLSYFQLPEECE